METACDNSPSAEHNNVTANDLAVQEAMYRLLVDNAVDLIVRSDAAFRRTYVSPSARDLLGYEPAELLGKSGVALVHPDERDLAAATLGKLSAAHPSLALVFRMRRKDGSYIWVEGRYRHLPGDGGVLAVLRDISAHKQAEEQLEEANAKLAAANQALQAQVDLDGLTGLANRRCFDRRIAQEFRRARRNELSLGLVLLDIDHFKAYNDFYGHLAGDDALRRVSSAVAGVLRRPADLAARYGGEEIAALLPETDDGGTRFIAERMREAVADLAIEHRGSRYGVTTVSAGISTLIPIEPERQPDDLIDTADRALYRAKAAGRNRVCGGDTRTMEIAT